MLTEVSGLSAAVLIRDIARRGLLIRDHPADGLLGNPEVLSGGLEIDVGLKLISHTNTSFKVRGRRPTRPIFRTARGGHGGQSTRTGQLYLPEQPSCPGRTRSSTASLQGACTEREQP